MHGNPNAANNRRKPLAPLPPELTGPARDFALSLRRMHGELGFSLKKLEDRLPASRSSLSRYLGGQSLPDERLLVQWCKLSFTGEDRLPELVRLLHEALDAAATTDGASPPAQAEDVPAQRSPQPAEVSQPTPNPTPSAPSPAHPRNRLKLTLATTGAVLAVAAASTAVALLLANGGEPSGGGSDASSAQVSPPSGEFERITVNNVDKDCRDSRRRDCALGLALDPYVPYRPSNIGGRAWHGDILKAECRIANGVTVTDEEGGHSSIWYRVDWQDKRLWMPGIRIEPDQLQYSNLQNCPD
ncbi:XRE family transcriptional regulator [Streptomyces sp. NPDC002851]